MKLCRLPVGTLFVLLWTVVGPSTALAQICFDGEPPPPLADWLLEGEAEEVDWDIDVDGPDLRMDQRLEVVIRGRIRARNLEDTGTGHDLVLRSWVCAREGPEFLAESGPLPYAVEDGLSDRVDIDFDVQAWVTPGDYTVWVLLVDETTGRHNLKIERVEVDPIDDDDGPFPDAFREIPTVEFTDTEWAGDRPEIGPSGDLIMPVSTGRPLDMEIIVALSAPEQWSSYGDESQHKDNVRDATVALAQLDVERGSKTVVGLDLLRQRLLFEQRDVERLDLNGFEAALDEANPGSISVADLARREDNPDFFRRFVEQRIPGSTWEARDGPLKVLVFVTGMMRFDRDADVDEIEFDGECDCVAYHVRIRQHIRDLFDQVEDIIDPLDPDTHTVLTPRDLRRAIGRIIEDLDQY